MARKWDAQEIKKVKRMKRDITEEVGKDFFNDERDDSHFGHGRHMWNAIFTIANALDVLLSAQNEDKDGNHKE